MISLKMHEILYTCNLYFAGVYIVYLCHVCYRNVHERREPCMLHGSPSMAQCSFDNACTVHVQSIVLPNDMHLIMYPIHCTYM